MHDDYLEDETIVEEIDDELAAGLSEIDKYEYDDKFILKSLMEGKTREEIAIQLNHKNYKTIDMYMRRRGYIWNSIKSTYVLKQHDNTNKASDLDNTSYKVKRIISYFDEGLDPMEIAGKVGMKDHRAVAEYMKSKGYNWSVDKKNYVLFKGMVNHDEAEQNDMGEADNSGDLAPDMGESIVGYAKLLEMLDRNKDRLMDVLGISSNNTIPRYVVGGIVITKSISMCYQLSELVKEFSKDKNISQREIFEVAVIEFLKKYGYENEINTLFYNGHR